jgi:lysophospholipase L1-like esterase
MTHRIMAGLLLVAMLAVPVTAAPLAEGDVKVSGMKVTVASLGQTVEIEPVTEKSHTHTASLKIGTPGWRGPLLLPGPAWAFRSLRPKSLVVTLADDPSTKLIEGKDYIVDPGWAAVAALKGSTVAPGTKLKFAYRYGLSRCDLIEKTADGKLRVKKGKEDKSRPLLPEPSAGATPLVGVYLGNYVADTLTMNEINLIDPDYDGVPPVMGAEHLAKVKARLATGGPFTVAFLGDSITAQRMKDFRDGKGSFVVRFATYLKESHAGSDVVVTPKDKPVAAKKNQIVVVKAGVGGDTTARGLRRLDKDVLAHKPDLVVVMFGVNDENRRGTGNGVPVAKYTANLATIIDKVRAAGGEVLVMTTSMKNLGWSSAVGNLDEYAAAARAVATAKKVCLVDCFRAWELLPKRGYNYMVFLNNCINHPNDLGHDLFIRGLKKAFE